MLDITGREDDPLSFLDHISKILMQEHNVLMVGLVPTMSQGATDLIAGPRLSGEF